MWVYAQFVRRLGRKEAGGSPFVLWFLAGGMVRAEAYHLCTSPQNTDTRAAVGCDAAAGLEAEGYLQVDAAVGGAGAVGAAGDVVGLPEDGRT